MLFTSQVLQHGRYNIYVACKDINLSSEKFFVKNTTSHLDVNYE
ncbi:hypothetical protein NIES267_26460 [Calothrix parasitica NIES-267]|uniref:Uncharacterized protein n=1 Tax=Calothrix parasitica NIES-267 TaxID=1973488 RepID=A0A1Z4LPK7_9CYAN|nr:hypothetical protein NIES267_26460 [Calothrix parasitica NIES-267]